MAHSRLTRLTKAAVPRRDAEQRTPAAQQVDGDCHGESGNGVNRRSWKADNTSPERGHGQDAQNANGHPSGDGRVHSRFAMKDIKGAAADL